MRYITAALFYLFSANGFCLSFTLTSPAFSENASIPVQYTCDGANNSPPLVWKNAPPQTQSFVLIVDDPDAPAGTWAHWLLYNIPSTVSHLAEAAPLPQGARYGMNSWGNEKYQGPCPPSGTHRYFFKLYALDAMLLPPANANAEVMMDALRGHLVGQAQLIGQYKKQ